MWTRHLQIKFEKHVGVAGGVNKTLSLLTGVCWLSPTLNSKTTGGLAIDVVTEVVVTFCLIVCLSFKCHNWTKIGVYLLYQMHF